MNQHILAKELLNYIKKLQIDENLNDWTCKGKTDITYGSPNGGWDGINGYLFEKKDKSFSYVIRSIPNENAASYIVIESLNLKGQLYNMDLSNPRICKENQEKTYLLESYRMTVGKGKKKEREVEDSFKSFGINTNEVSIIDDLEPNWSKTLTDILEWAILREKVKTFLKGNNISVTEINLKENFISWFIIDDGKKSNYFNKNFNSDKDLFRKELDNYETKYRDSFHTELFIIDLKNYKNHINSILENIKNEDCAFFKFRGSLGIGGKEAILGKMHYTKFLEEYFLNQETPNSIITKTINEKMALNQILYGPPGTGKTYNTINRSISIIDPNFNLTQDRKIIKEEYDCLVEEGQIVFTTFHQSMSYEDFIEGIKPETKNEKVVYNVQDGILKKIIKTALIEYLDKGNSSNKEDSFDSLYKEYINNIKSFEGQREALFTTKTGVEIMLVDANDNSILVKYLWGDKKKGQEGKQVFTVSKEKLKKTLFEGIVPANVKNLKVQLHPLIGHIHCELFAVYKHFYDFVVANKGEIDAVAYDFEDLTFKEVKEQYDLLDKNTLRNKVVKPFVIIIDEINRGNVSQIFGELITLIEDDKRLGKEEALEVTLPYSKDKFGVPANLFIIGTMNTADRSVESLDSALRRRFSFVEMEPKPNLIKTESKSGKVNGIVDGIDLETLLKTINTRIEKLIDKDHRIGHSYFLKVNDSVSLHHSFKNEIIPLLEEYFFGDFGKIGLVLGSSFVEKVNHSFSFAKFDEYDTDIQEDLKQKSVFKIRNEEDWKFSEI